MSVQLVHRSSLGRPSRQKFQTVQPPEEAESKTKTIIFVGIDRRLFCRSTVRDEHLREDHEAMKLESWFAL
jgi:hypothetical protein